MSALPSPRRRVALLLLALVATGALAAVAPASLAQTEDPRNQISAPRWTLSTSAKVTAPWSGGIDPLNKAAVNDGYQRRYAPYTNVPSGYTGIGCLLGTMSSASHNATLQSVNYVRAITGLMPVSFSNATMNKKALQAAVIMQANGKLSHDPLTSFLCYTLGGDEAAARSNLALRYPSLGSGQVVDLYMDDPGASNLHVGHRRWVLYPYTYVMGNGTTKNANALTVVGPTSTARSNPRWVRWPTHGYFPLPLEPGGRWSLSSGYADEDFRNAWIAMWKNGTRIYVTKHPVKGGYGARTVSWQLPSWVSRTGTFQVKVGNICRPGAGCYSTEYVVRLFAPY